MTTHTQYWAGTANLVGASTAFVDFLNCRFIDTTIELLCCAAYWLLNGVAFLNCRFIDTTIELRCFAFAAWGGVF